MHATTYSATNQENQNMEPYPQHNIQIMFPLEGRSNCAHADGAISGLKTNK